MGPCIYGTNGADMLYLHRTAVLRMGIKVDSSSLVLALSPTKKKLKIHEYLVMNVLWRKVQSHLNFFSNLWKSYICHLWKFKAKFGRRTSHEPNRMQMSKILCSPSFACDSAHVKYGVWTWPKADLIQQSISGRRCWKPVPATLSSEAVIVPKDTCIIGQK